mmetsp:Transcript_71284/g.149025  ORF Transcript_71284/g.149025 Transcript_71284/m.149025 type:complete len:91 (+) Transcript_71284:107-379(+)
MAAAPAEVTRLYRQVLRSANSFADYNFRCYFQRRTREDFRTFFARYQKGEIDDTAKAAFLKEGRHNAEVLHRQSVLSQLYGNVVHSATRK